MWILLLDVSVACCVVGCSCVGAELRVVVCWLFEKRALFYLISEQKNWLFSVWWFSLCQAFAVTPLVHTLLQWKGAATNVSVPPGLPTCAWSTNWSVWSVGLLCSCVVCWFLHFMGAIVVNTLRSSSALERKAGLRCRQQAKKLLKGSLHFSGFLSGGGSCVVNRYNDCKQNKYQNTAPTPPQRHNTTTHNTTTHNTTDDVPLVGHGQQTGVHPHTSRESICPATKYQPAHS